MPVKKTNRKRRKGSWYGVRVLIESRDPSGRKLWLPYEDRIILVRASSEDEAMDKAKQFGRRSNGRYRAAAGNDVVVRFKMVVDAVELFDDPLRDGSELFWNFVTKSDLKADLRRLRLELE